jgi:hypothetical protein
MKENEQKYIEMDEDKLIINQMSDDIKAIFP